MEYLVLASGDCKGFRKFRVTSKPHEGVCGHVGSMALDTSGVREQLPYRWRKAWDRSGGNIRFDRRLPNLPAYVNLWNNKGGMITTIYFQPLTK